MAKPAFTSEAFQKIQVLPEKRREQLDDMLLKGIVASEATRIIQSEWKIWLDEKPATVKKRLERYRSGELKQRLVARVAGTTNGIRAATLAQRVNAMDELEVLVGQQKTRFSKALDMEQKAPLLLKQATDEGRLLKEMLVELGRLQLETGVLARAAKKVKGTLTDSEGIERSFEWTSEQETLFNQIDGLVTGDYVSISH
jgi:hypothetical protein